MRTAVLARSGPGIPRPLVHRDESNVAFALDQCLCAVPMMHVPIHDQHTADAVALSSVMRADGDVAEETEAHAARGERVVSGRSHGAEAPHHSTIERHIDAVEDAARCGGR